MEKVRQLEDCQDNDEEFLKVLKELCDKTFWLSITTKDLYYWIKVLDKVDVFFAGCLSQIVGLNTATVRSESQEHYEQLMQEQYDILKILLQFTTNLLRESGSRSIYSSVDVSSLNLTF